MFKNKRMTNFVFTMTSVVSSLGYNLERYGSYNFGGNIIEAHTGVAATTFGNYHTHRFFSAVEYSLKYRDTLL